MTVGVSPPGRVGGTAGASAETVVGGLAVDALGVGAYVGARASASQLGAGESDRVRSSPADPKGAADQAAGR